MKEGGAGSLLDLLFLHLGELDIRQGENDDPASLRFQLIRINELCHNLIEGAGIVLQLAGEDAGGVLLLHELMAMEHLEGVLVDIE